MDMHFHYEFFRHLVALAESEALIAARRRPLLTEPEEHLDPPSTGPLRRTVALVGICFGTRLRRAGATVRLRQGASSEARRSTG